jgi:biotin-dependent carboxylase-like uncharacterized protein
MSEQPGLTARIQVIAGGPLTTIQDAGRHGLAHLGVSPSGFLDVPSARLANRLVGNPEDAALLETTGSGPTLRLISPGPKESGLIFCVTGAPAPLRINGRAAEPQAAQLLRPGDQLEVGQVSAGIRSYIAFRGGVLVPQVLGSRSTDLLGQLGPPPLSAGQTLAVGAAAAPVPEADVVPGTHLTSATDLQVYAGPSQSWFAPDALRTFLTASWNVSPTSSRIGLRLSGPILARSERELPPEGMITGSIQVPPDGQPVLLLNDRPVTGGYPVIAVLRERDLAIAAQAAPGTTIRFHQRSY